VRVSIVQGGGLVPIVTTTVADAASLSADDAARLRALVDEAQLLELPSSQDRPQPDRPTYRITIEDDGRSTEVTLDDAALSDAVRALVAWVRSVPGHEESVSRLG